MDVMGVGESIRVAVDTFRTLTDGRPDLIATGIRAVDSVIGGLGAGSCGVLAAKNGVGKSSVALAACLASPEPMGYLSLEDPPDVVGCRILAQFSGVDSTRIRRKDLTAGERDRIRSVAEGESDHQARFAYAVGGSLEDAREGIRALAAEGCRMIWIDYLQKIRGVRDDRRNEVADAFNQMQRELATAGVAGMVMSQIRRLEDPTRPPQVWHIKETSDIEDGARLIIMLHTDDGVVVGRVGKSTFGGEGLEFRFTRNRGGMLEESPDEFDRGERF